ncbi:hypothetical protein STEG23_008243, partial [Scotinomys teguina]
MGVFTEPFTEGFLTSAYSFSVRFHNHSGSSLLLVDLIMQDRNGFRTHLQRVQWQATVPRLHFMFQCLERSGWRKTRSTCQRTCRSPELLHGRALSTDTTYGVHSFDFQCSASNFGADGSISMMQEIVLCLCCDCWSRTMQPSLRPAPLFSPSSPHPSYDLRIASLRIDYQLCLLGAYCGHFE